MKIPNIIEMLIPIWGIKFCIDENYLLERTKSLLFIYHLMWIATLSIVAEINL